jgi:hypothetical protein
VVLNASFLLIDSIVKPATSTAISVLSSISSARCSTLIGVVHFSFSLAVFHSDKMVDVVICLTVNSLSFQVMSRGIANHAWHR